MKGVVTRGIILARTNFGEADRIITVLTPDHGKRRIMAKGVRKERSKLAGGIELFSVSHITFIPGKREIDTLISTRLIKHYGQITKDVQRTMLGYELLKRLNRATEDNAGQEYFDLMEQTLKALAETGLGPEMVELWFDAQLLKLGGHQPKLRSDAQGRFLEGATEYSFDLSAMAFKQSQTGSYNDKHIKLLRLVFGSADPLPLQNIKDAESVLPACQKLVSSMLNLHIRI